jgi:hypothetical protein
MISLKKENIISVAAAMMMMMMYYVYSQKLWKDCGLSRIRFYDWWSTSPV